MAKVTVQIFKNKEVKYEVEGLPGTGCADLTKALMANNEVLDQEYTSEFCVPEELPDYIADTTEEE